MNACKAIRITVVLAILAAAVGCSGLVSVGDRAAPDLDELQGRWEYVAHVYDGNITTLGQDAHITITGNMIKKERVGGPFNSILKLPADGSPGEFEEIVSKPEGEDTVARGVYTLQGDTLIFRYTINGSESPTQLRLDAGDSGGLSILRRA